MPDLAPLATAFTTPRLVGLAAGLLVLWLAVRALRNAAIALRARLFALGSGLSLLGVGLDGPLGLAARARHALGPWLDDPHQQIVFALVALGLAVLVVGLAILYFWVRAFVRVALFALVGLGLLGLLALASMVAEPAAAQLAPQLGETRGVLEVVAVLLVALGAVRVLRPGRG